MSEPQSPKDDEAAPLTGGAPEAASTMRLRADFDLPRADRRREFLRVRRNEAGGLDLFSNQSSGVLTSAVWADGLVDNPAGSTIARGAQHGPRARAQRLERHLDDAERARRRVRDERVRVVERDARLREGARGGEADAHARLAAFASTFGERASAKATDPR